MHKTFYSVVLLAFAPALFVFAQDSKPAQPPKSAPNPSQEMLSAWNMIGNKLIAMAEDFPEEKYSFKAQKEERTFGENLLHVAAFDNFITSVIGEKPVDMAGGMDSLRSKYRTKADIVNFLKKAVAEGAKLIEEQGDGGLMREYRSWGNRMAHVSSGWIAAIEHSGEHYGQLVVYYRLNGMVPPQSRPRK
jgi:uncharacterized damage-inducible protein DinB